jgi:hypothetical protein
MKNLGPYKKYIIIAAVIQSIVVIVAGYIIFRAKMSSDYRAHDLKENPGVEQQLE